jgi:hypothetical protein
MESLSGASCRNKSPDRFEIFTWLSIPPDLAAAAEAAADAAFTAAR